MYKVISLLAISTLAIGLTACVNGGYGPGYSYTYTSSIVSPTPTVVQETTRYYHDDYWYPWHAHWHHHRHGPRAPTIVVHGRSTDGQGHYGPPRTAHHGGHYGPPQAHATKQYQYHDQTS